MNPVQSDLAIRIARVEAEQRVAAARRHHLARQAATTGPTVAGQLRAIVDAIRELVDPRGYALRQLAARHTVVPDPVVVETIVASERAPEAAPAAALTVIEGHAPVAPAAKTAA